MLTKTNFKLSAVTLSLALLSVGCSDDDDNNSNVVVPPPVEATAKVRVTHASADAPAVNIDITGTAELSLENVDYFVGSGFNTVPVGSYDVAVNAILPGNATATVLSESYTLDADYAYDVIAVGSVAEGTLEALVIPDNGSLQDSSKLRVNVAHLASGVPNVDIHVTTPEAVLSADTVLVDLDYKETSGALEIDPADYRIRITLPGEFDALFDSGTVPLPAGVDLLIGAVNNTATGDSPVNLIVLDGENYSRIYDADAGAELRVIHNAAAVAEVDVSLDGSKALESVPFAAVSPLTPIAAGEYLVQVSPSTDPNLVALEETFAIEANKVYSVMAIASEDDAFFPFTSDLRSVATAAKTRIIHGSQLAGNVDIYLTPADAALTGSADLSGVAPALSDVPFLADTGFLMLDGAAYDVSITPVGAPETVAIFVEDLTISNGGVYTVIARDGAGEAPLGVILIDDSPVAAE